MLPPVLDDPGGVVTGPGWRCVIVVGGWTRARLEAVRNVDAETHRLRTPSREKRRRSGHQYRQARRGRRVHRARRRQRRASRGCPRPGGQAAIRQGAAKRRAPVAWRARPAPRHTAPCCWSSISLAPSARCPSLSRRPPARWWATCRGWRCGASQTCTRARQKTDARDAAIIAETARTMPHTLRKVQVADEQVAELQPALRVRR